MVFTIKTRHGDVALNPAGRQFDLYQEASAGGQLYYQWSNDNEVYSELGGLGERVGSERCL